MDKKILYSLIALVLLGGYAILNRPPKIPQSEVLNGNKVINQLQPKGKTMEKPSMQIDTTKNYQALIKTDKGEISVELYANNTPVTVNNFVYLSRNDYYDGVVFHRTVPGFMIQGGDPTGTGRGGPGYQFDDEPFEGEYTRGTMAMANAGPNTNGSQFFIMHKDYQLPPNYVIFGKAIEGLDVVDAIATAPTNPGGEGSSPVNPVKILSVEIIEQ